MLTEKARFMRNQGQREEAMAEFFVAALAGIWGVIVLIAMCGRRKDLSLSDS